MACGLPNFEMIAGGLKASQQGVLLVRFRASCLAFGSCIEQLSLECTTEETAPELRRHSRWKSSKHSMLENAESSLEVEKERQALVTLTLALVRKLLGLLVTTCSST
jgi:hypothetical protein